MKQPPIAALLQKNNCDGLLVSHLPNITWASGLVSSNALLYVDQTGMYLATDGRYAETAQKLKSVKTVIANNESLLSALKNKVEFPQRIGYQPEHINSLDLKGLKKALPKNKLVPLSGVLKELIAAKQPEEIKSIAKAQAIAETVLAEILELLKPGVSEKEIAAEIIYRQLKHGANGISPEFWPIVAFGANTALPHSQPSNAKLKPGDVVLFDFGCTVDGYCSDMSRTFAFGSASDKFREVYEIVLRAQEAGLKAAKAGIVSKELDTTVRDIIDKAGYGEQFNHSTGHGVGLEIHEWPGISPGAKYKLPEKSVITIEPGVYLPGEFGVRVEDMIVLKPNGNKNLTSALKELKIIT
jgi:Xaa-Pro aminopeptidase